MLRKTDINGKLVQFAWWALATIVFTLVVAIRIRLLEIPLERDEGEYAYAGQLILQGIPPYKLAYNMKFPGTYAAYALIMSIFGQTIHAIHLGLLLINVATITLIFLIGCRLINTMAGFTAGCLASETRAAHRSTMPAPGRHARRGTTLRRARRTSAGPHRGRLAGAHSETMYADEQCAAQCGGAA